MRLVRRLLERVLAQTEYVLRDKAASPVGLPSYVERLNRMGFKPATVLDVGVGTGTPWLYSGFPTARFELFEPVDDFVPNLRRICEQLNARYHVCALGAVAGEADIEVNPDVPTGSTLAGRVPGLSLIKNSQAEQKSQRRRVKVRRLDEFGPFPGPILLKLDVEGYESEVLKGAEITLAQTEVVISEVGVTQRHMNEMSFGRFMAFMETLGFSLVDFPELTALGRDRPLAYVDAAFVKTDGPFRR